MNAFAGGVGDVMLCGKEKLLLEVKVTCQSVSELLRQHVTAVNSVTRVNTTKGGSFDAASFRFFAGAKTSLILRLWLWL